MTSVLSKNKKEREKNCPSLVAAHCSSSGQKFLRKLSNMTIRGILTETIRKMAEALVILVIPVVIVAVASVGLVRSAVYVHGHHGEAIRQRVQRAFLQHKLPHPNASQPLSLVYEHDARLSRVVWRANHTKGSDFTQYQASLQKLHAIQRDYLNLIDSICIETLIERPDRSYRVGTNISDGPTFPEQTLFGATVLCKCTVIDDAELRQNAARLVELFEVVRLALLQQSLEDCTRYPQNLKNVLMEFEQAWVAFEKLHVSAPVVASSSQATDNGQMTTLMCEAVRLGLRRGLIKQEDIDSMEPFLFFVIPRLTIIYGLYYTNSIKLDPSTCVSMLSDHVEELAQLKAKLTKLPEPVISALERALTDKTEEENSGDDDDSDDDDDDDVTNRSSCYTNSSNLASVAAQTNLNKYFAKQASARDVEAVHNLFKQVCDISDHLHSGTHTRHLRATLRVVFSVYQTSDISSSPKQQEPIVISLPAREFLTTGSVLLKFTFNGKSRPHKRFVWVTDNLREIMWCEHKKRRPIRKGVRISDIKYIDTSGQTNTVLQHGSVKNVQDCVFSLVLDNRTVDFLASDHASRNRWVAALEELKLASVTPV